MAAASQLHKRQTEQKTKERGLWGHKRAATRGNAKLGWSRLHWVEVKRSASKQAAAAVLAPMPVARSRQGF